VSFRRPSRGGDRRKGPEYGDRASDSRSEALLLRQTVPNRPEAGCRKAKRAFRRVGAGNEARERSEARAIARNASSGRLEPLIEVRSSMPSREGPSKPKGRIPQLSTPGLASGHGQVGLVMDTRHNLAHVRLSTHHALALAMNRPASLRIAYRYKR